MSLSRPIMSSEAEHRNSEEGTEWSHYGGRHEAPETSRRSDQQSVMLRARTDAYNTSSLVQLQVSFTGANRHGACDVIG